jgi:hypothetical protein
MESEVFDDRRSLPEVQEGLPPKAAHQVLLKEMPQRRSIHEPLRVRTEKEDRRVTMPTLLQGPARCRDASRRRVL